MSIIMYTNKLITYLNDVFCVTKLFVNLRVGRYHRKFRSADYRTVTLEMRCWVATTRQEVIALFVYKLRTVHCTFWFKFNDGVKDTWRYVANFRKFLRVTSEKLNFSLLPFLFTSRILFFCPTFVTLKKNFAWKFKSRNYICLNCFNKFYGKIYEMIIDLVCMIYPW